MNTNGSLLEGSVLVIEDDTDMGGLLVELFTDEGFRVRWARDADEGLRMVKEDSPGVIFADLNYGTGSMDGYEFIRTVRKHFKRPIHVTSGSSSPDVHEQATAAGAESFVPKPYDIEKLVRLAREALHPDNQHKYS